MGGVVNVSSSSRSPGPSSALCRQFKAPPALPLSQRPWPMGFRGRGPRSPSPQTLAEESTGPGVAGVFVSGKQVNLAASLPPVQVHQKPAHAPARLSMRLGPDMSCRRRQLARAPGRSRRCLCKEATSSERREPGRKCLPVASEGLSGVQMLLGKTPDARSWRTAGGRAGDSLSQTCRLRRCACPAIPEGSGLQASPSLSAVDGGPWLPLELSGCEDQHGPAGPRACWISRDYGPSQTCGCPGHITKAEKGHLSPCILGGHLLLDSELEQLFS